jgi:hypothetical protein
MSYQATFSTIIWLYIYIYHKYSYNQNPFGPFGSLLKAQTSHLERRVKELQEQLQQAEIFHDIGYGRGAKTNHVVGI